MTLWSLQGVPTNIQTCMCPLWGGFCKVNSLKQSAVLVEVSLKMSLKAKYLEILFLTGCYIVIKWVSQPLHHYTRGGSVLKNLGHNHVQMWVHSPNGLWKVSCSRFYSFKVFFKFSSRKEILSHYLSQLLPCFLSCERNYFCQPVEKGLPLGKQWIQVICPVIHY